MSYTLITGASKGIGKALAEEFASRGHNLLMIARTEKTLKELAEKLRERYKVKVHYLCQDLSLPDAPEVIFDWCKINKLQVNILVNNVAYGLYGHFAKMKIRDLQDILLLNIQNVTALVLLFIPELKKQSEAHILNVSSTAAYQPVPYLSIYAASKAFINSFSGGLRVELKESGINVTCLAPGPTDSEFFNKSGLEQDIDLSHVKMEPEQVAKEGVEGMFNKKAIIIPGFSNKVGAFFSKRISSAPVVKALGKIFKPKEKGG
jgi:short-subunit dehydrogenase